MKWIKIIINVLGMIRPIFGRVESADLITAKNEEKHSMVKRELINTWFPKISKKFGLNEDDLDTIIKFAVLIWKRFILKKMGKTSP